MRKIRQEAESSWGSDRSKNATKSRNYYLGSNFTNILSLITDTDGKALIMKTDPAYVIEAEYKSRVGVNDTQFGIREETTTEWNSRQGNNNTTYKLFR